MKKLVGFAVAVTMSTVGMTACRPPEPRAATCYAQTDIRATEQDRTSVRGVWRGVGIWLFTQRVAEGDFRLLLGAPPFEFYGQGCIPNPEGTKTLRNIRYYDDG